MVPYYEKVLCHLRLHLNGILEVRPNFSKRQVVEHSHDSNIFVHDDTLDFWKKHGIPLTTYNFISVNGSQYQYSIELLNSLDDKDFDIDSRLILSRRSAWFIEKIKNGKNVNNTIGSEEPIMLMEISSAQNFGLRSSHFSSWRESTLCVCFYVVLNLSVLEEPFREPKYKLLHSGQTQYSKSIYDAPLLLNGSRILVFLIFLQTVNYSICMISFMMLHNISLN